MTPMAGEGEAFNIPPIHNRGEHSRNNSLEIGELNVQLRTMPNNSTDDLSRNQIHSKKKVYYQTPTMLN